MQANLAQSYCARTEGIKEAMQNSGCCTLILILLCFIYPIGAPIALGLSHAWFDCVWFIDVFLIVAGVGIGGLVGGWAFEPLGILKLSVGYGLAVILALFVIWQDHSAGKQTTVLEEGKPALPRGRRRCRDELARTALGSESDISGSEGPDTDKEVRARRARTARRTVAALQSGSTRL